MIRAGATILLLALGTSPSSATVPVPSDTGRIAAAIRAETTRDLVVLIHGLGRTKWSMVPLEWTLERAGYEVVNWGYSSTCCSVAELAASLAAEIDRQPDLADRRVHFVGHSLGGIVVRSLLAADPPYRLGRVVMLAPPNGGSELADRYASSLGWLLRPLPEITTEASSTARKLPLPESVEIGVIAGRFDGKVSVEGSHLQGEVDHVVVPSAHTFMMNRSDVRRLVVDFLRWGSFSNASAIE